MKLLKEHTVRKCSLMHQIFQHLEDPAQMARVTKVSEQKAGHRTLEETAYANSHE